MAATQYGVAVVWGVSGITSTGLTTTTGKVQSAPMGKTAKRHEILDGDGNLCGQIFNDQRRQADLRVIISGATLAAAKTNMDTFTTQSIGAPTTLADADGTIFDGVYSILDLQLVRENDKEAEFSMKLEMSEVNTATSLIS